METDPLIYEMHFDHIKGFQDRHKWLSQTFFSLSLSLSPSPSFFLSLSPLPPPLSLSPLQIVIVHKNLMNELVHRPFPRLIINVFAVWP